jgi:hypothetical protein
MLKIMLVCPNSTLGTLSDEMSLKSMVRPSGYYKNCSLKTLLRINFDIINFVNEP